MLLMLFFLGGGATAPIPDNVMDTHDGWAIHERAKVRESRLSRIKRTDQAAEIAAEMRSALAPKAPLPQPKAATIITLPGFDFELDDEEAILAFI